MEVTGSEENSTPPSPPALTLARMGSAGIRELFSPPAQEIFPGVTSLLNQPFALIEGYRFLNLDLHVPQNASGPLPVIVYASGGGFKMSLKHFGPWFRLLEEGYAVAVVEYRLIQEARFPAPLSDVKAAIRWVRANAEVHGLDSDRIVGCGSSAGSYLITMAAVTNDIPSFDGDVGECLGESSRLSAVIDHYGVADLSKLAEDTNPVPGAVQRTTGPDSMETQLLGFDPVEDPEGAAWANPATYVSAETVPFLILHGDADTQLGIGQSRRLFDVLRSAGADAEFHAVPGANHGSPVFDGDEILAVHVKFLNRVLSQPSAPNEISLERTTAEA